MNNKTNQKPNKKDKHQKPDHINPSVMHQIAKRLEAYNQIMDQDEMRKAKDKFMDLYQKCEFAFKELLTDYKIKVEGLECVPGYKHKKGEKKFNPERQNIYYSQVTKVLPYAGIPIDPRLFCNDETYKVDGNKSCRVLRNSITHKSSKKAVKEVFDRQTELYTLEITVERSNNNFNADNVSKRVSMICSEDFDKIIDVKSKSIVWQADN